MPDSNYWGRGKRLREKKNRYSLIIFCCKVGMITKQWSGIAKEALTDADNFGISFPLDLDVKVWQVESESFNWNCFR